MAIPAMALLQQHDARRDIVTEPAARRRAEIETRGIRNWGRSELGAQSGCKNPPACLLLSYFLSSFFARLISAVADWMSTILLHIANLECRSEMCCMRLAEDAGPKKSPQIRHLGTIAQLCRAISAQLRHVLTIGKRLVKLQYLPHMSPDTSMISHASLSLCEHCTSFCNRFLLLHVLIFSLLIGGFIVSFM